jgi:hypothetical protein
MVLGTLAATSLMYIRFVGGILALSGRRTLKWQRTSKFKALPDSLEALRSVQAEVLLALVLMILGCALAPYASFRPPDLLFVVTVGLWGSAVVNLAAPIMALLAELQLRR